MSFFKTILKVQIAVNSVLFVHGLFVHGKYASNALK